MRRGWTVGILLLALLALAPKADAFIYWGDYSHGRIGRAANDGSNVNPNFITGLGSPAGLAVTADHIYWANFASDTIGRANIDGTGVDDEFIDEVDEPRGVAVNSSSIYWTSPELDSIGKADLDGTDKVPGLLSGIDAPCGIALDSGHMYWSSYFGTIGRASLGGGLPEPEFVDNGGGSLCGVAVDTTSVYWVTTVVVFVAGTTIGRANLSDGGEVDKSIIGDTAAPCGIAVFGSQLYWANAETGTIGRADIAGSGASGVNQGFISNGSPEICGVAVDSLAPTPAGPPAPPPPAADSTRPKATISKGPGKNLDQGIAKFSFKSSEAGSTFRCKLDSKKPAKCKSPKSYKRLKPGRHTFKVWATDPAGNESKPASRSFRVPA